MDTEALRKARGAFFTPPELAAFVVDWAIRSEHDRVLEPSCGEAAFLLPAAGRLALLGADLQNSVQLHGVEIHQDSALSASRLLAEAGASAVVEVRDFFESNTGHQYDAVVGNPPYIRYQNFAGEARARSLRAALTQGVRLSGLASSWAAFTVHAAQFLTPGGRMGLVLPAELLTVSYAAEVRTFLLRRFARVRLVVFEERVFPGVLEDVVVLLAEGEGGAECFEVYQARSLADLRNLSANGWTGHTPAKSEKWTPALLTVDVLKLYERTLASSSFCRLSDWGEAYLGAVTGANAFFTLTAEEARSASLSETDLVRISPPGSRHLRGLTITEEGWKALVADGKRCYLFYPGSKIGPGAAKYIAQGERQKINDGYKCQKRKPWWRVPLVREPDLLFTYMNHDQPRLVANEAGLQLLNSLYGVTLKAEHKAIGKQGLPISALNSLTQLGAELEGRAFGGGLLKHEPKEAGQLPVPSTAIIANALADLDAIRPQVNKFLRGDHQKEAIELVDKVLLERHMNMSAGEVEIIRSGLSQLRQRRQAKKRGSD